MSSSVMLAVASCTVMQCLCYNLMHVTAVLQDEQSGDNQAQIMSWPARACSHAKCPHVAHLITFDQMMVELLQTKGFICSSLQPQGAICVDFKSHDEVIMQD